MGRIRPSLGHSGGLHFPDRDQSAVCPPPRRRPHLRRARPGPSIGKLAGTGSGSLLATASISLCAGPVICSLSRSILLLGALFSGAVRRFALRPDLVARTATFQSRGRRSSSLRCRPLWPADLFDGEILPATLGTFLNMAGLALLLRALRRPLFCALPGRVWCLVWPFWRWPPCSASRSGPLSTSATRFASRTGLCWNNCACPAPFCWGLLVAIAPVTLRNYAIGGDAVLISSNAGINFYLGNNPEYQRTVNIRPGGNGTNCWTRPR